MAIRAWVDDAVFGSKKDNTRIVGSEIIGTNFFGRTIRQSAAYAALSEEEFAALASLLGEEALRQAGFAPATQEVAQAAFAAEEKRIAANIAANKAAHRPRFYAERDREEVSDGFGIGLSKVEGFK